MLLLFFLVSWGSEFFFFNHRKQRKQVIRGFNPPPLLVVWPLKKLFQCVNFLKFFIRKFQTIQNTISISIPQYTGTVHYPKNPGFSLKQNAVLCLYKIQSENLVLKRGMLAEVTVFKKHWVLMYKGLDLQILVVFI